MAQFKGVRSIFDEAENLRVFAQGYHHECSGTLRVGASDNICNYLLPGIIDGFRKRFPKVEIDLYSGTSRAIVDQLLNDEIEIGLFYTALSAKDRMKLESEKIKFVEFVLVVPAGFGGSRKKANLDQVRGLAYVGSRRRDYEGASPAFRMLQSLGIEPISAIETNNQETQKRLVLAGQGYSIVPRHMVEEDLAAGRLQMIQAAKPVGTELLLVRRRGRALSKPTVELRALLLAGALSR